MSFLKPVTAKNAEEDFSGKAKKRLFIGLVLGTSAIVCLFLAALWVVPYVGLRTIHPAVPWIFGAVVLGAILVVLWVSVGLLLNVFFGKDLPLFGRMRGVTVRLFLPLMTLVGRALGMPKDRIRSSFIKVNNELVTSQARRYAPGEMLLLMPHCLQNHDCRVKITGNVENCEGCGKCPIKELLKIAHKYGVELAVATGGTIARRIVVQKRPRLIIAVACERDLTSGIQDTYPLPVYGIFNRRPFGPCFNTGLPLEEVEMAIRRFLDASA
ncbi:MAG: DUF116 domain-containing protein [Deltaproteobacteria bacterium]